MKTAVYIRISTKEQDETIQREAIQRWLDANPCEAEWFTDRGESSEATSRPQWDALLKRLRAGEFRRLVVWKMDRIGRWDIGEHLVFRVELKRLGIALVSITEGANELVGLVDFIMEIVGAEARAKWMQDHRDRAKAAWKTHRVNYLRAAHKKRKFHYEEAVRLYTEEGMNKTQIAKVLGVGRTTVIRAIQKTL